MKYNNLKQLVQLHNKFYYDEGISKISDSEYDSLYNQLCDMENKQGWKDADSPTQKIGGTTGKIKHIYPLYSLKKVYDINDIDMSLMDVSTPKIDGVNLSCVFIKGQLQDLLTRGDGEIGESVFHLKQVVKDIPEKINNTDTITILGEAVTDNKVENFRNYVAGSLGLKEPEDRNIRFICHDVLGVNLNYLDRLKFASKNGFLTVLDPIANNYPHDGVVYRTSKLLIEKDLGYTAKHPRFAVALKTVGDMAVTTLQKVEWTIGRSGVVTPVAIVDPVVLDDATINRVILHNIDFILENKLGIGDLITIERRITPQFVNVVERSPYNRISIDDAEKAIGEKLKKIGPKLYTSNENTLKRIEYYVKTLDIKGLGPASIEKMGFSNITDLYKTNNWEKLGVNGSKILEELQRPKTYDVVLGALGIPGVGKSTAKTIVKHLPSFDRLSEIEHTSIKGIGPKTIENILTWLDVNKSWVTELPYKLYIDNIETFEDNESKLKIVITGKLDISKEDLGVILTEKGYIMQKTVTKTTNILIYGEEGSAKYMQAKKYGIKLINYWDNKNKIMQGII